jgi:RimJ/RimL family protein N-acetyltransferase
VTDSAISLRPATSEDVYLLFAWRNDPKTRAASRQTAPVAWSEHSAWLESVLASPDRVIRIAEMRGHAVGVVRADRSPSGWELSWTVAPEARRSGVGRNMVRSFAAILEGPLRAVIRKRHPASAKVAAAAGLVPAGDADDPDFEVWVKN